MHWFLIYIAFYHKKNLEHTKHVDSSRIIMLIFLLEQNFSNLNDFYATLLFGRNKVIALYMQW